MEKRNCITLKDGKYMIKLNIPKDCIYDIDSIIVSYDINTNIVDIVSEKIVGKIKQNMLNVYNSDIKKYINILETNLEYFLSGKAICKTVSCDIYKLTQQEDNRKSMDFLESQTNKNSINEVKSKKYLNDSKTTQLPKDFKFAITKITANKLIVNMSKLGIYFITANQLTLQVQCQKCKSRNILQETTKCKCGSTLKSTFVATLDSEVLGSLFLENCSFLYVDCLRFNFNCEKCFTNYLSQVINLNNKFVMDCWQCSGQLSFCVKKITFTPKKPQSFKLGTFLPDNGTCKHYKKSFRWFRFPCCGSAYPCNICHDEENSHFAELANKMICGHCSKEQSVKADCDCGMSLKRHSACWEGGKGNRDKVTMNKKDKKKYTK